MTWDYTLISSVLHVTALISAMAAFSASRRRGMSGALALCLLMCAVAEWAFASGLEAAVVELPLKIIFSKIEYVGAVAAPTLFLAFVLEYIQRYRWRTIRNVFLLSVVPLVALGLTMTNEWHQLIWSGFSPSPITPNVFLYSHGPGFFILAGYDYLLVLTSMGLLVGAWWHGKRDNRTRISIILLATLFPVVAGLLYSAGVNLIPGLDLIPISFSVTGVMIAIGIFRMRIFNIIPIARDNLIENMRDGVLVLDTQDCVVDVNLAAQKAIGISAKEIIGQPASRFPADWMVAVCHAEDTLVFRKEICIRKAPPLYLDLQITPLYDHRQSLRGRLIVFRDVTERCKVELQLALRAEELDLLNRISLAITSSLDLNHVLKTLHEQCSAIIPCDVFFVALYDETTGVIHMPFYFEKEGQPPAPRDIQKEPGLTGYVIETRRTLFLPDVLDPGLPMSVTPVRSRGTSGRTYIGIPLPLRDKVIGVMSVQSYKVGAYNKEQIRLLETVAVEAAIAIENARLYGEVQRLAIIDELTGVYNYRGLIELGKREVERARRFDRPLSALFFDIDGFRNFNNTYTHATGNLILKAIASRSQGVLRSVDILTRYGGDEFVVLLPETSREMALQAANRLLVEIASAKVATNHGDLGVTISAGLAMLNKDIPDVSTLIENANRAEHRAKEAGNCVEIDE